MLWIMRYRSLILSADIIRSGSGAAMPNSGHHEQAIEVLHVLHPPTSHLVDHFLVVFNYKPRRRGSITPAVPLNEPSAVLSEGCQIGIDRIVTTLHSLED